MSELTQQRLQELLTYNEDTGVFTWKLSPNNLIKEGDMAGTFDKDGYVCIKLDYKMHKAHRLVWLYVTGSFPNSNLDHKDGDPSNNRYDNLREATYKENAQNRKLVSNNKSGYMGVSWETESKKWKAQISINGKRKNLGRYNTPEEAYEVYLKAKKEFHTFHPTPRKTNG